jgi:hypothetical protein
VHTAERYVHILHLEERRLVSLIAPVFSGHR